MGGNIVLQAEGISKSFGGLHALKSVKIDVQAGEVHALVGENGAGKSTLIKILGGIHQKDAGTVLFNGEEVEYTNPLDAIHNGIAIIHQELSMLPHLNVMENVFMGRMKSQMGRVKWKELEEETKKVLARVDLDINPYAIVGDLSISQMQLIEIAKALSINASLIIMDEPNSSLTKGESEILFKVINNLKQKDIAILYVSHKIEEVLRIADRITAYRDGEYVDTITKETASVEKIIKMMVGRELKRDKVHREIKEEVLLDVKNLTSEAFNNVSFKIRKGEILGFSGLVGAGRSEVARAIFGADKYKSGEIYFDGEKVSINSPKEAIKAGIAMVPEDRKRLSLFLELPIEFNMGIAVLSKFRKKAFLNFNGLRENNESFKNKLNIKMGKMDDPVKSLSGGNQQKTILGRWLSTDPKLLILDEPTHGVDIGAKSEIYKLIRNLADTGLGIILISSEMPEIISMSDRVLVMHEGCITGNLENQDINEEEIMACATGCIAAD